MILAPTASANTRIILDVETVSMHTIPSVAPQQPQVGLCHSRQVARELARRLISNHPMYLSSVYPTVPLVTDSATQHRVAL